MKVSIDTGSGVVQRSNGSGVFVQGLDYRQAPFASRFTDLHGDIHEGTGAGALTTEGYRDTNFSIKFFRHDQDDQLFFTFEMPHGWDITTPIRVHVHLIPMASVGGNAYLEYAYFWSIKNSVIPAGSGWTSGSAVVPLTAGQQYVHLTASLATLDPPDDVNSSQMFFFKFQRSGTSVLDTYSGSKDSGTASANIGFIYCDVHYQTSASGTDDENW